MVMKNALGMLNLRSDGRVELICKHGIGHTIALPSKIIQLIVDTEDPYRQAEMDTHFIHGCDGCCSK